MRRELQWRRRCAFSRPALDKLFDPSSKREAPPGSREILAIGPCHERPYRQQSYLSLPPGLDSHPLIQAYRFATRPLASPLIFMPALQWDLGRYSPWGKIMHINQQADIAIHEAIKQRRAAPLGEGKQDLFALLLEAKREDSQGLSDRELRDELVTMLLAGHETTAPALAWTFERILSLPKVYAKVMEELDIVFSPGARSPDRVPKLEYLDAVIKETHRFRPIMPIGGSRRVKAPFAVGGYMIPPGATLSNCMYLLHRRPDIY
ncbi:MAG: cytochrome P450, partial [Gammaproteobacteria bacterium]